MKLKDNCSHVVVSLLLALVVTISMLNGTPILTSAAVSSGTGSVVLGANEFSTGGMGSLAQNNVVFRLGLSRQADTYMDGNKTKFVDIAAAYKNRVPVNENGALWFTSHNVPAITDAAVASYVNSSIHLNTNEDANKMVIRLAAPVATADAARVFKSALAVYTTDGLDGTKTHWTALGSAKVGEGWRAIAATKSVADSMKAFSYIFAPVSGSGLTATYAVEQRMSEYVGMTAVERDSMYSWTVAQRDKALTGYLDLLMCMYNVAPEGESKTQIGQAIDAYIQRGNLKAAPVTLVVDTGVIMSIITGKPASHYVISNFDLMSMYAGLSANLLSKKSNISSSFDIEDLYKKLVEADIKAIPQSKRIIKSAYTENALGRVSYLQFGKRLSYSPKIVNKKTVSEIEWTTKNPRSFPTASLLKTLTFKDKMYGFIMIPSPIVPLIPLSSEMDKVVAENTLSNDTLNTEVPIAGSGGYNNPSLPSISTAVRIRTKSSVSLNNKVTDNIEIFVDLTQTGNNIEKLRDWFEYNTTSPNDLLTWTVKLTRTLPDASISLSAADAADVNATKSGTVDQLMEFLKGAMFLVTDKTRDTVIPYGEGRVFAYKLTFEVKKGSTVLISPAVAVSEVEKPVVSSISALGTNGKYTKAQLTLVQDAIAKTFNKAITITSAPSSSTPTYNGTRYQSQPAGYAEIKENLPLQENWEAMAGVPSNKSLYFAAGGSEFAVDTVYTYVQNVTTKRTYYSSFGGSDCEYLPGDTAILNPPEGSFAHGYSVLVVGCSPQTGTIGPGQTCHGLAPHPAHRQPVKIGPWTAASDKITRGPYMDTVSSPCHGCVPYQPYVPAYTDEDGNYHAAIPEKMGKYDHRCTASFPTHLICGDCCYHVMSGVYDSWAQTVTYDYMECLKGYVWRIDKARVTKMGELLGKPLDYTIKVEPSAKGNVFAHIATANTSAGGRLRYTFMPAAHDVVVINNGSRVNTCDKWNAKWKGTGIHYGESSYSDGGCKYSGVHGAVGHKSNYPTNVVGYLPANSHSIDKGTPEYATFYSQRNAINVATAFPDFIILQSTNGDQSVEYFQRSSAPVTTESNMGYIRITQEEIWNDNPNSCARWAPDEIVRGGYNGRYDRPLDKYKALRKDTFFEGRMPNVPTYFDSGDPAGVIYRPARPSGAVKFLATDLALVPTLPNKEYDTGEAYVAFVNILKHNKTAEVPAHPLVNLYTEGSVTYQGFELKAGYSDYHHKVNNVVIHTPASTEYAMVLSLPDERDQRSTDYVGGARDLQRSLNALSVCPRDAGLCEFRILNCKYTGSTAHTALCYITTDRHVGGLNSHVHDTSCFGFTGLGYAEWMSKILVDPTGAFANGGNAYAYLKAALGGTFTPVVSSESTELKLPVATALGNYEVAHSGVMSLRATGTSADGFADVVEFDIDVLAGDLIEYFINRDRGGGVEVKLNGVVIATASGGLTMNDGMEMGSDMEMDSSCHTNGQFYPSTVNAPAVEKAITEQSFAGLASLSMTLTYTRKVLSGVSESELMSVVASLPLTLANGKANPLLSCNELPNNVHVCTSECVVGSEVLNCKEPHHKGKHYESGNDICWDACGSDATHSQWLNVVPDIAGGTFTPGNFINLDYGFRVYFPNKGDFYGNGALGISSTVMQRGFGYVDEMDVTEWLVYKRVRFDFAVMYEGQLYRAREWIRLDKYKEYFDFYCVLSNSEALGARVEFEAVPINAAMGWTPISEYETSTVYEPQNDNFVAITNKTRSEGLTAYHGGYKCQLLDVVGRIGNLAIQDTTDFRYSNYFKQKTVGTDAGWYVDGLVPLVDETRQNSYIGGRMRLIPDSSDPTKYVEYREDLRGNPLLPGTSVMWPLESLSGLSLGKIDVIGGIATRVGDWLRGGTNYLNTYGTVSLLSQAPDIFPVSSDKNNIAALKDKQLSVGYDLLMDIQTIGNYYDALQIVPYYYALNLDSGLITPVDVHMFIGGRYQPINIYDNVKEGWDPSSVYSSLYVLDWEKESARRNFSEAEEQVTDILTDLYKTHILSEDGNVLASKKGTMPEGNNYTLGTAQYMLLSGRARTFIGSSKTYGLEMNVRSNMADPPKIQDYLWQLQAQRWYFKVGLPSSSVFVKHSLNPLEPTVVNEGTLSEIMNDRHVILCALNIQSIGDKFVLGYKHDTNGKITINGKTYSLTDPDPAKRITDPIVGVYSAEIPASLDLELRGTH